MREIKVNRADLLAKVRENRSKHVKEYVEAVEGYKAAALRAIDAGHQSLRRRVEQLQAGEVIALAAVTFDLKVPESHEKDYDQVIAMLEMSVDDTLTVRSDEFACYVMDDWDWKQDFSATKAFYDRGR